MSIQWYAKPYCLSGIVKCSFVYVAAASECNYVLVGYVTDGYACANGDIYVLDGYVLTGYVEA